ncbi:efflux RND transporter permease subunit [Paenibacillus aurantius]|uniref:Efflux RND transporter permease subunit n=1 Tax=Paenibacillus aurantius TaxID=2918900 RepID=A0AA96LEZ7_9BACL|nr:efflux RND transporter permease subunit [Paenibacillus aurantius]WNQ10861.1 efflux RND transporter permease subunit [Paenibacillus aurantius]
MTWFTKWSFGNKRGVGLLAAIALLIGVFSYTTLPMEFMPEADNPQITITALGQGKNTEFMEKNVTKPIENAVGLIKGKTDMFSTSGDGYSSINLNFDGSTDMKAATQEVEKAVGQLPFPEGVMKPFIVQFNTSMIPISQLTISFKGEGLTDKNIEKAEKEILPELQKVKGAASVALYGKTSPLVMVTADPQKLAEKGVPQQALMGVLQGKNVSASIGEQNLGGKTGNVNVVSEITSVDTLKKLQVVPGVMLQDVAAVELKTDKESVTRANGEDVLYAVVTKEASANAVDVGNGVKAAAEKLTADSENAELKVVFSTSDMVVDSVDSMIQEVLMGALFATVVILLFLRNIRATLITIVSIPLSLAITLYLLDLSGVTLNIITLGGVAVAVGRLVDDSIVVIENIYRRLQKEPFSRDMILSATKEVSTAITSSTIVTVCVFLPMGLLRGGLQAFLLPFALTVTYSLLASLLVALTVVPLLSSALLRKTAMKEHEGPKWFTKFLHWNLRFKWVTLLLAVVIFAGSIGAYFMMPKAALDTSSTDAVFVTLKFPSDTPVDQVMEKAKSLEKFIIEQNAGETVILQAGNSSENAKFGQVSAPTEATLTVIMKKDVDAESFIEAVRAQKDNYAGATLSANPGGLMGASSTTEYVDIIGDDLDAIRKVADQVTAAVKPIEGVQKVTTNMEETKPVFSFTVDPSQANAQEISMQLAGMLNPMPIGQIDLNGTSSMVMLDAMLKPKSEADLKNATILSATGPVPVTSLAKFEVRHAPSQLFHKDGKTYIRVSAEVDPKKVSEIGASIKKEVNKIEAPKGVTLAAGGASATQSGDFSEILKTMLVSIGLVYLIMVLTFKTLRAPFAIIMSLPLAAIGAILLLMITGTSPDFTAAFGALMLVGIVVTNAIVLIDRIKHNEMHMTIREAILEAATTRMRPIVMTAVATICAMLPLVFGHSVSGGMNIVSKSLAIVVIGGLASATVLTLIVIPALYELLYFRKSAKQRHADTAVKSLAA